MYFSVRKIVPASPLHWVHLKWVWLGFPYWIVWAILYARIRNLANSWFNGHHTLYTSNTGLEMYCDGGAGDSTAVSHSARKWVNALNSGEDRALRHTLAPTHVNGVSLNSGTCHGVPLRQRQFSYVGHITRKDVCGQTLAPSTWSKMSAAPDSLLWLVLTVQESFTFLPLQHNLSGMTVAWDFPPVCVCVFKN